MANYIIGTPQGLFGQIHSRLLAEHLQRQTGETFTVQSFASAAALDQALLQRSIDLEVNPLRTIPLQRPNGIILAAVTRRSLSHDILLVKKSTIKAMQAKTRHPVKVAVNNARRRYQAVHYMAPLLQFTPTIEVVAGSDDLVQRLRDLQEDKFDAAVVALGGLDLLLRDQDLEASYGHLLNDLDFMILPIQLFPPTAAQGTLAIECLADRGDRGDFFHLLQTLNDATTFQEVLRERHALAEYADSGEALGIHVQKIGDFFHHIYRGPLTPSEVGRPEATDKIEQIFLENAARFRLPPRPFKIFIGLSTLPPGHLVRQGAHTFFDRDLEIIQDEYIDRRPLPSDRIPYIPANFFLASSFSLPLFRNIFSGGSIWGRRSIIMKLAQEGYWANGSTTSLGEKTIQDYLASAVIKRLMGDNYNLPWRYLSHAHSTSQLGPVIPSYDRILRNTSDEYQKQLQACKIFFWSSFGQYELFADGFPFIKKAIHCCGLGKTWQLFQNHKILAYPFTGVDEFLVWILEASNINVLSIS